MSERSCTDQEAREGEMTNNAAGTLPADMFYGNDLATADRYVRQFLATAARYVFSGPSGASALEALQRTSEPRNSEK